MTKAHIFMFYEKTIRVAVPYVLLAVLIILTVGRELVPQSTMFTFHDQTQYARIIEFTRALTRGEIPPTYASQFNFGIGYPVFMFYAPVSYGITSLFHLAGLSVIDAFRMSILLGMIVGAWGIRAWLGRVVDTRMAWLGTALYVSSPWVASEIFVRGNLATVWFLALAPWSLWALHAHGSRKIAVVALLALTLMTHNALSLLWIPVLVLYAYLVCDRRYKRTTFVLASAFLFAGSFWIPALLQIGQTYAKEVAMYTRYTDHFLCLDQIWTAPTWGYGGSAPGCVQDGMSFMLGKLQILLASAGIVWGIVSTRIRRFAVMCGSVYIVTIFLSTYGSSPVWRLIPQLQVIQFPWRLLSIAHIAGTGLSVVAVAHTVQLITRSRVMQQLLSTLTRSAVNTRYTKKSQAHLTLAHLVIVCSLSILVIVILLASMKYFHGQLRSVEDISRQFTSDVYIREKAAFAIPEYVPRTVNYDRWLTYRTRTPDPRQRALLRSEFALFAPSHIDQIMGVVSAILGGIILVWLL